MADRYGIVVPEASSGLRKSHLEGQKIDEKLIFYKLTPLLENLP